MNATETRTGGARKPLGQRIEKWLCGRATPAGGRTRMRAALAIENLEGRVVLTQMSLGPAPLQLIASEIVQTSASLTYQHPQSLPTVVNALESPQVLSQAMNLEGVRPNSSISFWMDVSDIDIDVENDLGSLRSGPFGSGGNNSPVSIAINNSMQNGDDALTAWEPGSSSQSEGGEGSTDATNFNFGQPIPGTNVSTSAGGYASGGQNAFTGQLGAINANAAYDMESFGIADANANG